MNVVVDTSVWVDFFRGHDVPELEDALSDGRVVLAPVVVAELLSGARRPQDVVKLRELLDELPVYSTPREHWVNVGLLRRKLSREGVSVSVPDAHVARCSIELGAVLLSRDSVLARIAQSVGLKVTRA